MKAAHSLLLRFVLTGGASTALCFGLLMALQPVITSVILRTALCYLLSMCANFLAQALRLNDLNGGNDGRGCDWADSWHTH